MLECRVGCLAINSIDTGVRLQSAIGGVGLPEVAQDIIPSRYAGVSMR
jgi:hypothetical protein